MATTLTLHTFEANGLGQAPFTLVSVYDAGKVVTCCDSCSTGIRYQFWIRSHDGKNSKVGIDCIRKLHNGNNKLLNDAEREMARIEREIRNAKQAAKWEAIRVANAALVQAERDVNGGLTLAEIEKSKRDAEKADHAAKMTLENGWLINVIIGMSGDFLESMTDKLKEVPAKDLSDRCLRILSDVYAKATGGRGGSKKYNAASEEFWSHFPDQPE